MEQMTIGRLARRKIVDEVGSLLKERDGALVLTYAGIPANTLNQFRRKLKESGAKMLVVKTSLAKKAAEELGVEGFDKICQGQSALLFPSEDTIEFARLVSGFVSEHKKIVEVYGAVIESRLLSKEDIINMSKLESKDYLYATVLGALNAPISGFVGALNGIVRKMVYVLNAIAEEKQKNG